jgi:membrane-anchored protein YejM (alkaline phosphatase superfamily)
MQSSGVLRAGRGGSEGDAFLDPGGAAIVLPPFTQHATTPSTASLPSGLPAEAGAQPTPRPGSFHWLAGLLLGNYAVLLCVSARFLPGAVLHEPFAGAWAAAVWLTYPLLYLLPALALSGVACRALSAALARRPRTAARLSVGLAALAFSIVQLLILADERVHALYGFHLNGFVWNLLVTPGGIRALGAGPETYLAVALLVTVVFALEAALAFGAERLGRSAFGVRLVARPVLVSLLVGFVVLSGFERLAFGASRVSGYTPILEQEEAFPFYQRTSFNSLAERLGFSLAKLGSWHVGLGRGQLAYPLHPLTFRADAPRSNVLVLCAESLRADALTPEQMPATWQFAQRGLRFEQHLSGGNGTRMGVFGLFYGLPGSYWFRFLNAKRGPALVRALLDRGYDVRGFTADDFSYPEFDQTVFADLGPAQLREGVPGKSWERDRAMAEEIVEYLEQRDPDRPFFLYAFFESPHARYDFPPETAVFEPYLRSFDYVTMNLERDIDAIHNRYRNSVRHLDTQYQRVLRALEERGLLSSTLVVITGDHGEEFLENGRWGHNSAFSEEQIRVPLLLSLPGGEHGVVDHLTSHLDLPATLLEALGVENPPEDYSLGHSMLSGPPRRWALVSDWSQVEYVDGEGKVTFPMRAASLLRQRVADRADAPLADPSGYLGARTASFAQVMTQIGRFIGRR